MTRIGTIGMIKNAKKYFIYTTIGLITASYLQPCKYCATIVQVNLCICLYKFYFNLFNLTFPEARKWDDSLFPQEGK